MNWRRFTEDSERGRRLRQRAAALGAVFLFLNAVVVAVGLGSLLLVLFGSVALAGLVATLAHTVARRRPWRGLERARLPAGTGARAKRSVEGMVERTTTRVGLVAARARRSSGPALSASRARARDLGAKLVAGDKTAVPTRLAEWRGWPYAGSRDEIPRAPRVPVEQRHENRSPEEPRRRALELNARGVQLRRAGDVAAAIDQHDEAIEILRRIGDRRAQAPALNGLALALVAAGKTEAAVERFEESLEILRDLDDRGPDDRGEEARVTANLGFTLLKQGADERARELLAQALEQLPPESPAAHQVEAQLRRAS